MAEIPATQATEYGVSRFGDPEAPLFSRVRSLLDPGVLAVRDETVGFVFDEPRASFIGGVAARAKGLWHGESSIVEA